MNLVFALAAAALFGAGAYLILHRDLVRLALGVVVISQAAVLTLMASSIQRGAPAIYPLPEGPESDPLSQAMALTAIVIGMAVTALLLVADPACRARLQVGRARGGRGGRSGPR